MRRLILTMFLVIALGTSSGCSLFSHFVYVKPLMPVITHPKKPVLEKMTSEDLKGLDAEAVKKLQKRDAQLKDHAERYRRVVERYNAWADEQNEKSGYGRTTIRIEEPEE